MDLIVLEDENDIESGLKKAMKEDKLYVAVGKETKENESLLSWAIQNSGGRIISILHVHQPDYFIPILGEKFHWSSLKEQQITAYREIERQFMHKNLDEYVHFCRQFGVQVEKHYIEMDSIEKGIVQLIAEHNVEKLVMGAAADDCYHTKMTEIMSKKAGYVQLHAPIKCHIWFICKGHLIHQRRSITQARIHPRDERSINSKSLSLMDQSTDLKLFSFFRRSITQAIIHPQDERSINSKSLSLMDQSTYKCAVRSEEVVLGEGSSHFGTSNGRVGKIPSTNDIETTNGFGSALDLEANCHNWSEILQLLRSEVNEYSVGSPSHLSSDATAEQLDRLADLFSEQDHHCQLSAAQRRLLESVQRESLKKNKEFEDEFKKVKNDRDKLKEELQDAMEQNAILESKVSNYDQVVKQLEEGFISNVELLQVCEYERDDLKLQRDHVLKTAEELLNQSVEASSETEVLKFFTTFTFAEIKEATNDFDPELQLWEGENGSIYKGVVSCTEVTIKMWRPEGLQGPREFHQEVEILSKFRHPNMVLLMGVCPEAWAVIYEHLPTGSLQERLNSRSEANLSWQTRIRIATELCSALIFLHSRSPRKVIHGALQPDYIFLDSNFTCKIGGFEFSQMTLHHEYSSSCELFHSSLYTDPEYCMTGEATPAMDVYSFGLILLELLTGKPAFGLRDELEDALDENSFHSLLDTSAGDWPFIQAKQLAQLALRCCKENGSDRPDLESDVWRVLEPMRTSSGGSTSYHLGEEQNRQAPSYFICPIFQEVMKDPHIAADGYTYDVEALQGWLDSGHDTSPMTNLKLDHFNLVPNHSLRSAIQEWREQQRQHQRN